MTNQRKKPEPKLDYEITDPEALQAALPELVTEEKVVRTLIVKGIEQKPETTHRKFVSKDDKGKLYRLVKLNHELGRETPGVTVKGVEAAPAIHPSPLDV